jgi:hypothetical protein
VRGQPTVHRYVVRRYPDRPGQFGRRRRTARDRRIGADRRRRLGDQIGEPPSGVEGQPRPHSAGVTTEAAAATTAARMAARSRTATDRGALAPPGAVPRRAAAGHGARAAFAAAPPRGVGVPDRFASSPLGVISGRFVEEKRDLEQAVGRNGDRIPQPVRIGLPVGAGQRIKITEQRAPRRLQQVESSPGRCRPGRYCERDPGFADSSVEGAGFELPVPGVLIVISEVSGVVI